MAAGYGGLDRGTELEKRDDYHVIGRTAFGELYLWGKHSGQSLHIKSAAGWIFPNDQTEKIKKRGEDRQMRLFFSSSRRENFDLEDSGGKWLFERALEKLGMLDHDTIYGFEPALVLGSPCRLENLKKLNAFVHLDLLAGITEPQLMADICKISREAGLAT